MARTASSAGGPGVDRHDAAHHGSTGGGQDEDVRATAGEPGDADPVDTEVLRDRAGVGDDVEHGPTVLRG